MSFDWRDFLTLARFLTGLVDSPEAALRSAVSRAYYAAFCHARNYARDYQTFVPTRTAQDHALVRSHFQAQGYPNIASALDDLRQWRNGCDYNDVVGDLSQTLNSALENSQEIIDSLNPNNEPV